MRDWLQNSRPATDIAHVNDRATRRQAATFMYRRHSTLIQQPLCGALWTISVLCSDIARTLYAHNCSAAKWPNWCAELVAITQAQAQYGGVVFPLKHAETTV